jgi:hypothetical protein
MSDFLARLVDRAAGTARSLLPAKAHPYETLGRRAEAPPGLAEIEVFAEAPAAAGGPSRRVPGAHVPGDPTPPPIVAERAVPPAGADRGDDALPQDGGGPSPPRSPAAHERPRSLEETDSSARLERSQVLASEAAPSALSPSSPPAPALRAREIALAPFAEQTVSPPGASPDPRVFPSRPSPADARSGAERRSEPAAFAWADRLVGDETPGAAARSPQIQLRRLAPQGGEPSPAAALERRGERSDVRRRVEHAVAVDVDAVSDRRQVGAISPPASAGARRGRGDGEQTEAAEAPPEIRVSIGRLEVHAPAPAAAAPSPVRGPRAPRLTLQSYLARYPGRRPSG